MLNHPLLKENYDLFDRNHAINLGGLCKEFNDKVENGTITPEDVAAFKGLVWAYTCGILNLNSNINKAMLNTAQHLIEKENPYNESEST